MKRSSCRQFRYSCLIKLVLGLIIFFYIGVAFTFLEQVMRVDVYSQHDISVPSFTLVVPAVPSPPRNAFNNTKSVDNFNDIQIPLMVKASINTPFDVGLNTAHGLIRIRLYNCSDNLDAWRFFNETLAHYYHSGEPVMPCNRCSLYRAEPVPSTWGSIDLPNSSFGGRWGPPYALMQGSVGPNNKPQNYGRQTKQNPNGSDEKANSTPVLNARPGPKGSPSVHPSIKRGMVAWAGGGGGPHFFIALADHPEWGHAHTVFGEVLPADMTTVVAQIMTLPNKVHVPQQHKERPTITNLVAPVPFAIQPGNRIVS